MNEATVIRRFLEDSGVLKDGDPTITVTEMRAYLHGHIKRKSNAFARHPTPPPPRLRFQNPSVHLHPFSHMFQDKCELCEDVVYYLPIVACRPQDRLPETVSWKRKRDKIH